jgi:hypothetical protein
MSGIVDDIADVAVAAGAAVRQSGGDVAAGTGVGGQQERRCPAVGLHAHNIEVLVRVGQELGANPWCPLFIRGWRFVGQGRA